VFVAARREFAHLNRNVLDDARVRTYVEDGRNFLLTTPTRYDLISVQVSSMWMEGEADLYNTEFYQAARERLTDQGVLEQWLPLHHISTLDVARALASVHRVFPEVSLWVGGHQGLIVASRSRLRADVRALADWTKNARLAELVRTSGFAHPFALFGHLCLDTVGVDRFVNAAALREHMDPAALPVDDDRPHFEFSTPRGNMLRDAAFDNLESLRHFAAPALLAHLVGLRDQDEQNLLLAWAAHERGFQRLARRSLDRVGSPLAPEHRPLVDALTGADQAEWP
jgi:spermidine synthase